MGHRLAFREDDTFTIVQLTDVHWRNGDDKDMMSRDLMERVVEAEQPDLVIFTGDLVAAYASDDPIQSLKDAVKLVEERQIPWALVYGNHDTERLVSRQEFTEAVLAHAYSVTERGPVDVTGYGNFTLPIVDKGDRVVNRLYFFDSGSMSPLPNVEGYDWIRRDQIEWYVGQSQKYTADNDGVPIPALAFFHIPLPEYQEVWERSVCYGNQFEDVCCPKVNSGLFAAMVEMGDVAGTFVGHDHVNDYWGTLHGIKLCYGRATGYNEYGREGFARGARVIRLRAGEREFETWLRLDDGSVVREQPMHQPERR